MEHVKRSTIVTTNSGHMSEPLHLYYLKNMVSACRLSMQQIFTTDKSAMTQVPYVDMDYVIKHQGKKYPKIPPSVRERQYEEYLAKIGCFVVNFEKGYSFVEAKDPINDIAYYIQEKNKLYSCSLCGQTAVSKDGKDYTGEKCELCGNKTMKQTNPADVEANLKRIRKLI